MFIAYYIEFLIEKLQFLMMKRTLKNKNWDEYLGKFNVISLDISKIF